MIPLRLAYYISQAELEPPLFGCGKRKPPFNASDVMSINSWDGIP